ncbi:uncharacterized protein ACHE_61042S [Aspergillus chevalieri]|uniref:Uncharacterized protein n=1 Tax=Aspergillus chevalieri TaxID=182096 RepID=A0A7R7VUT7_ASPCH|nr:uncharacterized protein ACHE_61042S [Aspergillus chevalieri]BCR91156.1 hypothetical protein ACHE_61042S [Aspergillus chevalieri]
MGPNGALGRPKPRCPSSARPNGAPKKLAGRGPLPQTQSGVSTSAPKPAPAGFGAGSGRGHGAICDTLFLRSITKSSKGFSGRIAALVQVGLEIEPRFSRFDPHHTARGAVLGS